MKKAIASAGLLAIGAISAQTAMAQLTGGTDKPWSVSATLRGFYDDNINTAPSGSTNKVGSFGFEIRPSVTYGYHSGPNSLTASYLYSFRYYDQRANGRNDQTHDFELGLVHHFSELYSLSVSDSFAIAQEPEILSGSGPTAFPLRSNGNNLRNTGTISFNAQLTRLFGIVFGYSNTIYDYEENAGNTSSPGLPSRSALLDRMEHTVTLDTTWLVLDDTTAVVGYKFGAVDYSSPESIDTPTGTPVDGPVGLNPLFIASSTRNNYSHSFYVGADHTFLPELVGSVRVGLEYLDYYNSPAGSVQNSLSPYATASLSYTYTQGGVASLSFSHLHNQTDQAANAFNPGAGITQDQESSSVSLAVNHTFAAVSPGLVGSITAQYQDSVFNGGSADGEADQIFLLGLNLTYHFTRYLSTEVGYNYDKLSSSLAGRPYDRNRVYIGLTATY